MKNLKLSIFVAALLGIGFFVSTKNTSAATFPLQLSADKSYFLDASGQPFLIQGDSPWSILVQLSNADAEIYLDDRQSKGFNMLVMNLIENYYMTYPNPPRWKAPDGRLVPIFNTTGDFSKPNEEYFTHVDWVLNKAAEKGMAVLFNPAYMGYQGGTDGWWAELIANGTAKSLAYGRWVGERYKNYNNIIWVAGGDRTPPSDAVGTQSFFAVLQGINEKAPNHLWTAHWNNNIDTLDTGVPAQFWDYMGLNGVYAYPPAPISGKFGGTGFIHERILRAYNKGYPKPIFLWESWYEGTNWDRWVTPSDMLRRAAYEANLSGSAGQNFGSNYLFPFGATAGNGIVPPIANWKDYLDSQGSFDMARVNQFFSGRPWYDLVPDQSHAAVTGGFGILGDVNYVTAAYTNDKKNVFAYIPSNGTGTRTITVNMVFFSGAVTAQWYNPTKGSYRLVGNFANSGSKTFTTPGNNGTGTSDWVLALEVDLSPRSPIAYWKMDDPVGSTTILDSAPSLVTNNGSNKGAVLGVPGKINTASQFDGPAGTINRIEIPKNSIFDIDSGESVTISAWIKPGLLLPGAGVDPTFIILAKNDWNYSIIDYTYGNPIDQRNSHLAFAYMDTTGQFCEYFLNNAITYNNIYHIAATHTFGDGSLFKFYVNGVAQGGKWSRDDGTACTGSIAPKINSNKSIWIGADEMALAKHYTEEWIGMIDDVRIYDRVLTQAEITELTNPSSFAPADVNEDGRVNIKDIQICIKAIVDRTKITDAQYQKCLAVAPPETVVNIKDIQEIIREIIR